MSDNAALVIIFAITAFAVAAVVVTQIRTSRQRPVSREVPRVPVWTKSSAPPRFLPKEPTYRYRLGDRVEFRWPGLPEPMSGRVASRTIWKGYPHYRVVWDNGYASGPLDLTDCAQWAPEALLSPEVVAPPPCFPLAA